MGFILDGWVEEKAIVLISSSLHRTTHELDVRQRLADATRDVRIVGVAIIFLL